MTVIPYLIEEAAQLTWREDTLVVVVAAEIVHFVFNRWEPMRLRIVAPLLFLLPALLSFLFLPHFGRIKAPLVAFVTFYATLSASIALYRLSPWHPMARYPGPVLAKISKAYMVFIVRTKKGYLWYQEQHEKYGDVVRIGPNEIIIRDVSAVQPMMGMQGMPRGPSWSGRSAHQKVPSLVAERSAARHAQRRKPWNRAFAPAALKEYEPMFKRRATQLVEMLGKQKGLVDLAAWINRFSYDFMGDMVFGGGTEFLMDGDSHGILSSMKAALPVTEVFEQIPWVSYYMKKIPSSGKRYMSLRSMATARATERFQKGSTTKDIFYYLSNEDGADKVTPPREVVLADALLAIVAGSDTTAGTLSAVFSHLLRQPEMYKRLRDEVDRFYPPGEDSLDTKYHQDMPYLEAIINEALRLYPAVPNGSQRAPEVGKGDRVAGTYYIPEGNSVRINFYSLQRDPRYFSHPEMFWPDRWLIAAGVHPTLTSTTTDEKSHTQEKLDTDINHDTRAFLPFSFGPANCVGKHLAMKNMRTVLCHSIQKLEFGLPEDVSAAEAEKSFVYANGKLPVVVRWR